MQVPSSMGHLLTLAGGPLLLGMTPQVTSWTQPEDVAQMALNQSPHFLLFFLQDSKQL